MLFPQCGLRLLLLAAILTIPGTPATHAAEQRCFSETGQCIDGRFLGYWQANGGLAVFGFPISSPRSEINRDDGQPYLTQWFERNRLELHPENTEPYDVLLGRLGDDRLRWQSTDWRTLPRADGPRDGCLWFEQTRHSVCDQAPGAGFKSYWLAHGVRDPALSPFEQSLALFGQPLSEATEEVNPTDGQRYLTQWFERARFEWHPDKPDQYKVLLGLLGNELHLNNGLRISANMLGQPAGRHPMVYWIEPREGQPRLLGAWVESRSSIEIADAVDPRVAPAANGLAVAWVAPAADGRPQRVMLRELPSHAPLPERESVLLDAGNGSLQIESLALAYGYLFYVDLKPGHRGLYARVAGGDSDILIDTNGREPFANDGVLLWSTTTTNGQTGAGYRETWQLHMRKLDTGDDRVLTTISGVAGGRFSGYSVAGDTVVWSFAAPNGDGRVYRYSIRAGQQAPISPDAASSPSTDGSVVVWATDPLSGGDRSTWSVQSYDLASGAIATLASGMVAQSQRSVMLIGSHVVFAIDNPKVDAGSTGSRSLYMADLS